MDSRAFLRQVQRRFCSRWQQDAVTAAYLLDWLTTPGALIIDPLAGHGTYGCAAIVGARHLIGVEADAERFAKAVEALRGQRSPSIP